MRASHKMLFSAILSWPCLLPPLAVQAAVMSSANYAISQQVLGDGGAATSSPSYRLDGTAGQPSIVGLKRSSSYVGCLVMPVPWDLSAWLKKSS